MTVGGERDSFFDVHQQGRIEALERLIAELRNENLKMTAISTAHEEDPDKNSGVTFTKALIASRLCDQGGGDEQCRIDPETS